MNEITSEPPKQSNRPKPNIHGLIFTHDGNAGELIRILCELGFKKCRPEKYQVDDSGQAHYAHVFEKVYSNILKEKILIDCQTLDTAPQFMYSHFSLPSIKKLQKLTELLRERGRWSHEAIIGQKYKSGGEPENWEVRKIRIQKISAEIRRRAKKYDLSKYQPFLDRIIVIQNDERSYLINVPENRRQATAYMKFLLELNFNEARYSDERGGADKRLPGEIYIRAYHIYPVVCKALKCKNRAAGELLLQETTQLNGTTIETLWNNHEIGKYSNRPWIFALRIAYFLTNPKLKFGEEYARKIFPLRNSHKKAKRETLKK